MKTGQGKVAEILLDGSLRIECSLDLTPSPGQYLHAHKPASDSPLPVSLFSMESTSNGFRSAPPTPLDWKPGDFVNLRGPLGHGFQIPTPAKKIALIALDESIARLYGLISSSLKQNREVVLVCNSAPQDLPEAVEVQRLQALVDILKWADYVAFDVSREVRRTFDNELNLNLASATHPLNLNQLKEILKEQNQLPLKLEAQILVHTSMPCGGIAECGVCALTLNHEWKMICKEGPVFRLQDVS
jgi:dihydroorotate dehydrogenase electron transfer subunit